MGGLALNFGVLQNAFWHFWVFLNYNHANANNHFKLSLLL